MRWGDFEALGQSTAVGAREGCRFAALSTRAGDEWETTRDACRGGLEKRRALRSGYRMKWAAPAQRMGMLKLSSTLPLYSSTVVPTAAMATPRTIISPSPEAAGRKAAW